MFVCVSRRSLIPTPAVRSAVFSCFQDTRERTFESAVSIYVRMTLASPLRTSTLEYPVICSGLARVRMLLEVHVCHAITLLFKVFHSFAPSLPPLCLCFLALVSPVLFPVQKVGVTVHTDGGRIDFSAKDIDACGFIPGKKTYSWTGGEMEADLCIVCTGAIQPSPLYGDSGLQAWLNEKGQVKVGASNLQLGGFYGRGTGCWDGVVGITAWLLRVPMPFCFCKRAADILCRAVSIRPFCDTAIVYGCKSARSGDRAESTGGDSVLLGVVRCLGRGVGVFEMISCLRSPLARRARFFEARVVIVSRSTYGVHAFRRATHEHHNRPSFVTTTTTKQNILVCCQLNSLSPPSRKLTNPCNWQ